MNLPVRPQGRDGLGKPRTASDVPYEHGARNSAISLGTGG